MVTRKSSGYFQPIFAALIFGALIPLAFAPWNWWLVSIFSTAGLVLLLQQASGTACFWRAFFFGLGMFGTGASWVYVSIHIHGNTPVTIAAALTFVFIVALAIIFALPFYLLGVTHSRNTPSLLLGFPCIWVFSEVFRGWVFTGFPWLYLGNAFIDTWLSGWGPIVGVHGLSWIVAFASALIACIASWKSAKNSLKVGFFITIVFCLSGFFLAQKHWTTPAGQTFSVGLIQPATPLKQKWDRKELLHIINNYQQQNQTLLKNDLIVWPESAIPALRRDVAPFLNSLNKQALDNNTGIILGIPTKNHANNQYFNSVVGLGFAEGEYHKQHLVPFGEYIPFESLLRGLIGFFDLPMSSFSAGSSQQQLLSMKGFSIGTAICYEIAFPNLVRNIAANADFLITVSNDAWFSGTIAPHQHLQIAQMRALENGKPLIRATNDGISAIIDHKGRIQATIPPLKAGVLEGWIAPHKGQTPFNQYGNTPLLILLVIILLITARFKSTDHTPTNKKNR